MANKGEEQKESGAEKLMSFLFKYAKKFIEKKDVEAIRVGVIGMPNVGKSSLINNLKSKPVCSSGSTPFITKSPQEVKLNSLVTLVDTPGVLSASSSVIRSSIQVDDIIDPIEPIADLLNKVAKPEILRHYRIANFNTVDEMLSLIALKKGLATQEVIIGEKGQKKQVKKQVKQVPNLEDAARRFLRDFLNNRLQYYSKVEDITV